MTASVIPRATRSSNCSPPSWLAVCASTTCRGGSAARSSRRCWRVRSRRAWSSRNACARHSRDPTSSARKVRSTPPSASASPAGRRARSSTCCWRRPIPRSIRQSALAVTGSRLPKSCRSRWRTGGARPPAPPLRNARRLWRPKLRSNKAIPAAIDPTLSGRSRSKRRAVTSRLPFRPYHLRHGFTSQTKFASRPDVARSGRSVGPRRFRLYVLDLGRIRDGAHHGASCAGALRSAQNALACYPVHRLCADGRRHGAAVRLGAGPLLCQRVRANLNMHRARLRTFAALHQPGCAVTARTPQASAFPARARIVNAPVEALGKKAERIGNAQHHHLPVLEGDETVIEVGGGDRDVFAEADRVVVIDPGVIARLGARALEPFEAGTRIFEVGEALRAVIAVCIRPVQRVLAFAAIEADQAAVRARAPEHAVLVDVAAANADAFLRNGIELRQFGLGIEAHEAGLTNERVDGVPDRAVGRMRHHGVRAGACDPHVLVRLRRRARLGVFVDLAVAVGIENEGRPALRFDGIAGLIP